MKLTRFHLAQTFPTLHVAGPHASERNFRRLLSSLLQGWTDNHEYASDMARILTHLADCGLYSKLPRRLQSYCAVVELFLMNAPDEKMSHRLRMVAKALAQPRNAHLLRCSLSAQARQAKIDVGPAFKIVIRTDPRDVTVHLKLPKPQYELIKARAKATDQRLSDILRHHLLDYQILGEDDEQ